MNRELLVFVLFLLVNISLAVNCLVHDYAVRNAEETSKRAKPHEVVEENIPNQIETFDQIIIGQIDSVNPIIVRLKLKDQKDVCLNLSKKRDLDSSHLFDCPNRTNANSNNSLWLVQTKSFSFGSSFINANKFIENPKRPNQLLLLDNFREVLNVFIFDKNTHEIKEWSKEYKKDDKEYDSYLNTKERLIENRFNSLLLIVSKDKNGYSDKSYLLLYKDASETSDYLNTIYLYWNQKTYINPGTGEHTKAFLWKLISPIGIVVDILTLPFQFIYILYQIANPND